MSISANISKAQEALREAKTIAVVGMSANPIKASHDVAKYLAPYYQIVPVNPNYTEIMGLTCYPDLTAIPFEIDMVDVFQRSENIPPLVPQAIAKKVSSFWMQLGISHADARSELEAAGILVIEDLCTKIEHARMA